MPTGFDSEWCGVGSFETSPGSSPGGSGKPLTASPGTLHGRCEIAADRLVAHCKVGKGEATIVADADILDVEHLDGQTDHNLDAVLAELARLEHP